MQQVDVERSQEFRKCIECFLCQNTCHVIRDHEENKKSFAGPRFLMRIAELDMHPLDTADRRRVAQEEHGLGLCNITKCCTEVCPEHIKITDNALIPMKERVADLKYDPVVNLGSTIPTRGSRKAAKAVATDPAAAEALALAAAARPTGRPYGAGRAGRRPARAGQPRRCGRGHPRARRGLPRPRAPPGRRHDRARPDDARRGRVGAARARPRSSPS